jgi:hypothetical protein
MRKIIDAPELIAYINGTWPAECRVRLEHKDGTFVVTANDSRMPLPTFEAAKTEFRDYSLYLNGAEIWNLSNYRLLQESED